MALTLQMIARFAFSFTFYTLYITPVSVCLPI